MFRSSVDDKLYRSWKKFNKIMRTRIQSSFEVHREQKSLPSIKRNYNNNTVQLSAGYWTKPNFFWEIISIVSLQNQNICHRLISWDSWLLYEIWNFKKQKFYISKLIFFLSLNLSKKKLNWCNTQKRSFLPYSVYIE